MLSLILVDSGFFYFNLPGFAIFKLHSFLFQNVNAIEVSVPVGNVDHTTYVVGLTTFLVSASTFYILVTLFRSHSSHDGHIHQD